MLKCYSILGLSNVSYFEASIHDITPTMSLQKRAQHPCKACCCWPKAQSAQQEAYGQGARTPVSVAQTGPWLKVSSGFETYKKHMNTPCNQSNTILPKTNVKYLDGKIKLYLMKKFLFLPNDGTESIYPNPLVSRTFENYRANSAILSTRNFLQLTYVRYRWKHNAYL